MIVHFQNRFGPIVGTDVDRADGIFQNEDLKTQAERVQDRIQDAIISG